MLTARIRVGGLALIVTGLAAWAITDVTVSAFAYGDPWAHIRVFTRQDLSITAVSSDQAAKDFLVGRSRAYYFTIVLLTIVKSTGGWWPLALMALALSGFLFAGGTRLTSLWFLTAYLTIVGILGGLSPTHPAGRIDVQRYWICFLVPAGLAAAGAGAEIAVRIRGILGRARVWPSGMLRPVVNGLVALLLLVGPVTNLVAIESRNPQLVINGADQLSQLRGYLAAESPDNGRIVTDFATARLLGVYQRSAVGGRDLWQGEIATFTSVPEPRPGDLVVINSLNDLSCYFCHRRVNDWYDKHGPIPASWEVLWRSDPAHLVLYRVR